MQENIRWCLEQRWTPTKPQSKFGSSPGIRQNPQIISLHKIFYQLLGCFSSFICLPFHFGDNISNSFNFSLPSFLFFSFPLFSSTSLCLFLYLSLSLSFLPLSLFFFTCVLFRRYLFSITSLTLPFLSFLLILFSFFFFKTFPVLLFFSPVFHLFCPS